MQFNFVYRGAQVGQVDSIVGPTSIDSLFAALVAQVTTIVVGGADDGLYQVRIQGANLDQTFEFDASANTIAEIADGLAADALTVDGLTGTVSVTSDGVDTLTLAFSHPGYEYTVSAPGNPAGNLSITLTQAAIGREFPLGVGLVNEGDQLARLPQSGDTALDIVGVSVRSINRIVPLGLGFPAQFVQGPGSETLVAPLSVACLRLGSCYVTPEVAVAAGDPVYCRVIAGAGEQAGAFRNDADGGDAVLLPGRYVESGAAGDPVRIQLGHP